MSKPKNPFLVNAYYTPSYFCNREEETQIMIDAANNGRDITLFSLRRMGKTGLIDNVGYYLKKKYKWLYLYTDIFSTDNELELIEHLTNSVLVQLYSKKSILTKFADIFKRFAPQISFDAITGVPKVRLQISDEQDAMNSLEELFAFVESLDQKVYWAFDEFQQINNYDNSQAILRKLRTLVQKSQNIRFVFSGSHSGMLLSMFEDTKAAFYKSTQLLNLQEIDKKEYVKFILLKFKKAQKLCTDDSVELILSQTMVHTWFVQYLCNRLYQNYDEVQKDQVMQTLGEILQENEISYFRYRTILTSPQWNLLRAIGREERVYKITASDFIEKYRLGSSASVLRSLNSLMADELVVELNEEGQRSYRLQDVFLIRWFQWKYN